MLGALPALLLSNGVYKDNEPVTLYANKVGPFANPSEVYAYYSLPFCPPADCAHSPLGCETKREDLGPLLKGDRPTITKYSLRFKEDMPILETDVLQPMVRVHPRTGRRSLYASPTFTTHIDGMHEEESKAVLQFVYEWIARPEFCTRVSWHENQVVMWDNRSLQHKGLADDCSERRVVQVPS